VVHFNLPSWSSNLTFSLTLGPWKTHIDIACPAVQGASSSNPHIQRYSQTTCPANDNTCIYLCIYLDFLSTCRDVWCCSRAIWGSFDIGWRAPARLRCVAFRLGYSSWGLIMMLLSGPWDHSVLSVASSPSEDAWGWQVSICAPSRNSALWIHRSGVELWFTLCVFVCLSLNLHNSGSVKYMCWVILLQF